MIPACDRAKRSPTGREEKALNEITQWIAPVATMIAAMMTAANLGARITGWGFVVFTLGSICWTFVGIASGQTNLIAANGFLTLVNLVGIWRWLGRQRAYEDGGKSAETNSRKSSAPTLFTATGIVNMPVVDSGGESIGNAVEALVECRSGEISYVVIATGSGLTEELRAVRRAAIDFDCDKLAIDISAAAFMRLPLLDDGDWPARPAPQAQAKL